MEADRGRDDCLANWQRYSLVRRRSGSGTLPQE
jgi:hypothetical protein